MDWTKWELFPDPLKGGLLKAPIGPGVYEFRHKSSKKLVLFGIGGHVAWRLTSILPKPHGTGTRNNSAKRDYCLKNLADLEYRTLACATRAHAAEIERDIKTRAADYIFKT